jgi:hypothetical protein
MIVLRCTNLIDEKVDLEVLQNIDLRVDVSTIEVSDIGESFGIASQEFVLPGTDVNNNFFGNLYNLGSTYTTGSQANFTNTIPTQVLYNGAEVFTGKLILNDVVTDQRGYTNYNVTVINETVDFKYAIEDKVFGDLDWNEYEHLFNHANITASWENNLFGGDILYPLINYGTFEKDDGQGNIRSTRLEGGGQLGQFDNADSPLPIEYFLPSIRISAVLDKIFESTEYTYTSSFFDSTYGQKLYLLTTQDDKHGTGFISPISNNAQAYFSDPDDIQVISPNQTSATTIELNNENYDNNNNFNTTFYKYTCPVSGIYSEIKAKVTYNYAGFTPIGETRFVTATIVKNGTTILAQKTDFFQGAYQNNALSFSALNVSLATGDTIELKVSNNATDAVNLDVVGGITNNEFNTQLEVLAPTTLGNQTLSLQYAFNPEEPVLDFLKGLIQKFNLVIEPVANERNVIRIEPFNDWVDLGEREDWTQKVDRATNFEITHPVQNSAKKIQFTDLLDEDVISQYHLKHTEKIFGEFIYNAEGDVAQGEQTIGSYFACTPSKGIPSTTVGQTEMIMPFLYDQEPGEYGKPFKFKPRILHSTGVKDVIGLNSVSGSQPVQGPVFFIEDYDGTVYQSSTYASLNVLEDVAADFNTTRDLHFGNLFSPGHWPYHQNIANGKTKGSAFSVYWAFRINELYDVDARLLTCDIEFTPDELQEIRLNNRYFIDGHDYRINKIKGFNLTKPDTVTVELLKASPRKSYFPRRRIFDIIGDFDDIVLDYDRLNPDGGGVYNLWDTGTVYTASGNFDFIKAAGFKDGVAVYSGSDQVEVVWNTLKPEKFYDGTVINFGNAEIDDGAMNVQVFGQNNKIGPVNGGIIQGNNNEIRGGVDVNILGSDNVVFDGAERIVIQGSNVILGAEGTGSLFVRDSVFTNTTGNPITLTTGSHYVAINPVNELTTEDENRVVIGNAKVQGSTYEDYTTVNVDKDSVIYLTGSTWENTFHFHFSYTGSENGTAFVYFEGPFGTDVNGEQKRFTTDGTLTASKTISLAPITGSIDGGAEKTLTTVYDGLTVAVINEEWQVIQEKAK